MVPTVSGRMSSGTFAFYINTEWGRQMLEVSGSQIEIDAAYEGTGCLALFEAKRDLSDDFLVRQIYYPMRAWCERITKPVKPVFPTVYFISVSMSFRMSCTTIPCAL